MPHEGPSKGTKRKDPPASSATSQKQPVVAFSNKRAKVSNARTIRREPADAALKDGELNLQAFMESRGSELRSMEKSIQSSATARPTRAFQLVPREMRRRTASHNPNRVPKKLRPRAMYEMAEDNTPAYRRRPLSSRSLRSRVRADTARRLGILAKKKKAERLRKARADGEYIPEDDGPEPVVAKKPRPKIRRDVPNDPPKPKSRFRKRQKDKTWLPTHMWQVKRALMSSPSNPIWGFAMPLTPTQKSYRPTHRAANGQGAIAWDMSYMSTIGLYGSDAGITAVIQRLGQVSPQTWSTNSAVWTKGCQPASIDIFKLEGERKRLVGPAVVIWNPSPRPKTRLHEPSTHTRREVFIRVHPSIFKATWDLVHEQAKSHSPKMHLEDLRYEVGSIEVMGNLSNELLRGVLEPYYTIKRERELDVDAFRKLNPATGPENCPVKLLFGFSIKDPRLLDPPRTFTVNLPPLSEIKKRHMELLRWGRTERDLPYRLFDRNARHIATRLPSKKSLDRRRRELSPGKYPPLSGEDPPIPIIVYLDRQPTRWTILAPFQCIGPVWQVLMKYPLSGGGNPRLGCLEQQQQVAFEQGLPWFPGGFPGTEAGLKYELEERAKRKKYWSGQPPGKRVTWEKVDLGAGRRGEVGNGMTCDFEFLFNLPGTSSETPALDQPVAGGDGENRPCEQDLSGHALAALSHLSKAEWDPLCLEAIQGRMPYVVPFSILNVKLTFLERGSVSRCARIYRLPEKTPTEPPSSDADVAGTMPQGAQSVGELPADLREQWLAKNPRSVDGPRPTRLLTAATRGTIQIPAAPRIPASADLQTRMQILAKSLFGGGQQLPFPDAKCETVEGAHPMVPNAEDLVGFVTSGSFNLCIGRPSALGSVDARKVLEDIERNNGKLKEVALCIVRNAGESVGRLARWDVV